MNRVKCPMKGDSDELVCSAEPNIILECRCRDCKYWKWQEATDPFHSKFRYRENHNLPAVNVFSNNTGSEGYGGFDPCAGENKKTHTHIIPCNSFLDDV